MDNTEAINNMIDKIISGENTDAKVDFDSLLSQKLSSSLDAKKQELAQRIYSNIEAESNGTEEETTIDPV